MQWLLNLKQWLGHKLTQLSTESHIDIDDYNHYDYNSFIDRDEYNDYVMDTERPYNISNIIVKQIGENDDS